MDWKRLNDMQVQYVIKLHINRNTIKQQQIQGDVDIKILQNEIISSNRGHIGIKNIIPVRMLNIPLIIARKQLPNPLKEAIYKSIIKNHPSK